MGAVWPAVSLVSGSSGPAAHSLGCICGLVPSTQLMVFLAPQGSITPMDYALAKCYLPCEDMVLTTYCVAAGCLMLIMLIPTRLVSAPFHFGQRVLRKFKTM